MASIPTESRIFADRYYREARRLEALHAGQLSPGCMTWRDALSALSRRAGSAGGPIKAAAVLQQAICYLRSIPHVEAIHVGVHAGAPGKRTAYLTFAAFHAGTHPLGLDEAGLQIRLHSLACSRGGFGWCTDVLLTYISRHAMARLHERGYRLNAGAAFGVFGTLGVLGLLTRHSDKHRHGGISLHHGNVLAVGSLKHAATCCEPTGRLEDGTFLDVRTVLPADEVRDQGLLDQGAAARRAVTAWLEKRTLAGVDALAEQIPFLPRREDDYTLRMAMGAAGAEDTICC